MLILSKGIAVRERERSFMTVCKYKRDLPAILPERVEERVKVLIAADWKTSMSSRCGLIIMEGVLSRVSEENRHLLTFVSTSSAHSICSNAFVLIPGLTDGFLSLEHVSVALNLALLQIDYSLVQVNLSSSFDQFGFQSLDEDQRELDTLIQFIKDKYKFNKIVLMGHSTGCQDILYLFKHGHHSALVDGIILQAAVSDRDSILATDTTPSMLAEAHQLEREGKVNHFLTKRHCDAPITAKRFLSLAGRLTPDDMFSVDLTDQELTPILSSVQVPALLVFSKEDEYVPDKEKQISFADRMVRVLKVTSPVVDLLYVPGADHSLTTGSQLFIERVTSFITKYI